MTLNKVKDVALDSDKIGNLSDNVKFYNVANYMQKNSQTAEAALRAILTDAFTNGGYTAIYCPKGIYDFQNISSPFDLPSNTTLFGDGKNSTVFYVKNGTLFTLGNATTFRGNVEFRDIQLFAVTNPATTQLCLQVINGGNVEFNNVDFNNVATILDAGTSTTPCYSIKFNNLSGSLYNLGYPAFILRNGAGLHLQGSLSVAGTNTPTHGQTMNTVAGTDLINIRGSWDTIMIKGLYERFYRVVQGVANGFGIYHIFLDGIFDYIRQSVIALSTSGSGAILNVGVASTSWLFCWEGSSIDILNNSGTISDIRIMGCDFGTSGDIAIHLLNVSNFAINGNTIKGCGQASAGNVAIYLEGTCTGYTLSGNNGYYNGTDAWGANPIVIIKAANDKYSCTGNSFAGYIVEKPTTSNANRLVKANNAWGTDFANRYDKAYVETLPASGVAYNNPYPFEIDVYLVGGTVSTIQKGSQAIASSPPANSTVHLILKPNESMTVTYTVAPSFYVYGLL